MKPFKTPQGPTIHVDLVAVSVVSPISFQATGPDGLAVPALGMGDGAMLVGFGFQSAVVGNAEEIAGEVAAAKELARHPFPRLN